MYLGKRPFTQLLCAAATNRTKAVNLKTSRGPETLFIPKQSLWSESDELTEVILKLTGVTQVIELTEVTLKLTELTNKVTVLCLR